MIYHIKAHANLRHYLPEAREDYKLQSDRQLSMEEILTRLGIPKCEILLAKLQDSKVLDNSDHPEDNAVIELFPILAGG